MNASQPTESFAGLLLRYRGRARLTQRDMADRLTAGRRTVQEWEAGVSYPSAERLQALIRVLLEVSGLGVGHEREEAEALWAAVLHEAPRMHPQFDQAWFGRLLAARAVAPPVPAGDVLQAVPAAPLEPAPSSAPRTGARRRMSSGSSAARRSWR